MGRSRRRLAALAVADAVLLVAALVAVATRAGDGQTGPAAGAGDQRAWTADPATGIPVPGGTEGIPQRRSAGRGEVADRPWPARVAAPGPWTATLAGRGDRVTLTAPGTVPGGIDGATIELGASDPRPKDGGKPPETNRFLALPDGSRWYPLGPIRLEGRGDVAFSSATAKGSTVTAVAPSLEALLRQAGGVTGVGTFVQPQGARVERLALPPGTALRAESCRVQLAAPSAPSSPCQVEDGPPPGLTMQAVPGTAIRGGGSGEVAVAGAARATALGRTWDGLVGAIEAQQLRASATYADDVWTVTADGGAARQVWVDVWPVIDTRLTARSVAKDRGFFDPHALRIEWTNVGFASSQILSAEGVGPGAAAVGFDLNKTMGHDAGLGVTRGDRVVNLAGGGDIDSNLPPGERVERGLSATPGTSAAIVLKGNFPDVTVPLAIPRT